MRKAVTIVAALLVSVPAMLLSTHSGAAVPPGDMWTVMIYIDADNNLEPYGELNLQMLESVGSSDSVNFVVLIDTYSGPAYMLYVKQGSSEVLAEWGEVNMGNPATMTEFIKEAREAAPASKYCFVSWDHGGGWRGLNWDDTAEEETGEPQYIDMIELRAAVENAGLVFDVFAFDECLMAQPEVAYQLRGYASYLVFSEETIYGQGFPYDMIARDLVSDPTMSGRQLAETIVTDFAEYYESISWANDWTISAFDMSAMDDLKRAVTHLASAQLATLSTYKSQFKNDLVRSPSYYYPYYHDLWIYASNVYSDKAITDKAVKQGAAEVMAAVEKGVVLSLNSKHNRDSTGLSIYFPSYRSSYLGLKPGYQSVPFAIDTGWALWLQAFCSNK